MTQGYEYISKVNIFGFPLVHICTKRDERGSLRWAIGIIAIGRKATGLIAIGQLAIGVFLSIGQAGFGLIAINQLGFGWIGIFQVGFAFALAAQVGFCGYGIGQVLIYVFKGFAQTSVYIGP